MRYVSLFSGIEAASVAWHPLGFEPVAFAEVEPFCCDLLEQRFPGVPNLGDVSKIDWSDYAGSVDVVVGGSPCQAFSIAGNRGGLADERGRLMFEYVRAVRDLRPKWLVWENVPGALSSEGGEAFRCLLRELDELGYCVSWRVLDAQFFGVAQRRRRVFLVGSLGTTRSAEVLFEPEGLRWDTPSSRDKRQSLAADAQGGSGASYTLQVRCGCAGGGKGALIQEDVSATLSTSNVQTLFQPIAFSAGMSSKAGSIGAQEGIAPTLRAGASGTNMTPTVCYAIQGNMVGRHDEAGPQGCGVGEEVSFTLNTKDRHCVAFPYNAGGYGVGTGISEEVAPTLRAANCGEPAVCMADGNSRAAVEVECSGTLKVGGGPPIVASGYIVRRLMPVECERLQGFPDDWTDIESRGKPASDTARYKALGNSMAVPVMAWIGQRIKEVV